MVRRETAPKDGADRPQRLRLSRPTSGRLHFATRKRVVVDFNFHRPKSFHHQPRKVMAYIVVILTATCIAVSAFVLHRTLPK
jgi:hypothetical protein